MDIVVGKQFLYSSPAKRRRLIDSVWTYVKYQPFVQLIRQIDANDSRGTQITYICLQLAKFNSNAKLWDDVELWLTSEAGWDPKTDRS